jgi:glucosamine-6-phosphate deaminase
MDRFVSKVDPGEVFFIRGHTAAEEECRRIGALIRSRPIDVALIGIGENAHLAFNDPPADFTTEEPFIIVNLDEACRLQQVGEGWFQYIQEVPSRAISMSIAQIMKSTHLIVSVPDQRKAEAVKCAVEGPVDPECPASILQNHSSCFLYLDKDSSSLLNHAAN